MQTIALEPGEWAQVMNVLANTTGFGWAIVNPLLMKIGQQLQAQQAGAQQDGSDLDAQRGAPAGADAGQQQRAAKAGNAAARH